MTGLQEVPAETVDVAEGMGLTRRQILFGVELPMALPTIFAGLRIAASSTVGSKLLLSSRAPAGWAARSSATRPSAAMVGSGVAADDPAGHLPRADRARRAAVSPLERAVCHDHVPLGPFGDAIDFIFQWRESQAGTVRVGGLGDLGADLDAPEAVARPMAIATLVALPLGVRLGHIGRYQFLATSTSNIGRALSRARTDRVLHRVPGRRLPQRVRGARAAAIPPIITNAYVGIRGVDPETVDAASGNGLTGRQVPLQVEFPLALPTIMAGVRIALVSVIATATIAPLANVDTLGRPIVSPNVYGTSGQLAACIVALVTFAADGALAALQRAVTPRASSSNPTASAYRTPRPAFPSPKRSIETT